MRYIKLIKGAKSACCKAPVEQWQAQGSTELQRCSKCGKVTTEDTSKITLNLVCDTTGKSLGELDMDRDVVYALEIAACQRKCTLNELIVDLLNDHITRMG